MSEHSHKCHEFRRLEDSLRWTLTGILLAIILVGIWVCMCRSEIKELNRKLDCIALPDCEKPAVPVMPRDVGGK